MTIPIIPGPFTSLGQGLSAGLESFNAERQRQYEQANAGARLILGLTQAGMLDPSAQFASPEFQTQLERAKIPVPPAGAVVPSSRAQRERIIAGRGQQVQPGSIAEDVLFDINGKYQVSETELKTALNDFRIAAAKDPALARLMTDLIPGDIAQGREAAARASIAPKEYDFAAENFVSQAGLKMPTGPGGQPDFAKLAENAKALAAADPQYRDLVASGQLSDEYFASAARRWQRLSEEDRIKYADIAARRLAAEREARYYYDAQRKSYDTEIAQLQATIKQNELSDLDKLFLTSIQQKIQKRIPLDASEQEIMRKVQAVEAASAQIDALTGERQDLRDRFIGRLNPIVPGEQITPPSGAEAAARRGARALDPRLQAAVDLLKSGRGTADQLRSAPNFTDAEKKIILDAVKK